MPLRYEVCCAPSFIDRSFSIQSQIFGKPWDYFGWCRTFHSIELLRRRCLFKSRHPNLCAVVSPQFHHIPYTEGLLHEALVCRCVIFSLRTLENTFKLYTAFRSLPNRLIFLRDSLGDATTWQSIRYFRRWFRAEKRHSAPDLAHLSASSFPVILSRTHKRFTLLVFAGVWTAVWQFHRILQVQCQSQKCFCHAAWVYIALDLKKNLLPQHCVFKDVS